MRPKLQKLLSSLDLGNYLVNVYDHHKAAAVPLSQREKSEFIETVLDYCCNEGRPSYTMRTAGAFIITKESDGTLSDVIPMTKEEHRGLLINVLGVKA